MNLTMHLTCLLAPTWLLNAIVMRTRWHDTRTIIIKTWRKEKKETWKYKHTCRERERREGETATTHTTKIHKNTKAWKRQRGREENTDTYTHYRKMPPNNPQISTKITLPIHEYYFTKLALAHHCNKHTHKDKTANTDATNTTLQKSRHCNTHNTFPKLIPKIDSQEEEEEEERDKERQRAQTTRRHKIDQSNRETIQRRYL